MSVEFFACSACEETYADCGYYFNCDCGQSYCGSECGEEQVVEGIGSCKICRQEYQVEWVLLNFLLEKFNLSREEVTKMYFGSIREKQDGKF